ncbi:MAG: hypothetical protein J2P45_03270 [Candidatus Dormibacteraeota bacterium]|nr:hypothetical protein [Candidatus Dormibacteraeota bacterium]
MLGKHRDPKSGDLLRLPILVVAGLSFLGLLVVVGLDVFAPGQHTMIVDTCLRTFELGVAALLPLVGARALR